MHELSIAQSLIELACEAAERESAQRVSKLSIRVGVLAGVVKEALLFSFEVAAEGTLCAGAELHIEPVGLTAMCARCARAQELADLYSFQCPTCGSPTGEIVTGRELDLVSIEVVGHAAAYC